MAKKKQITLKPKTESVKKEAVNEKLEETGETTEKTNEESEDEVKPAITVKEKVKKSFSQTDRIRCRSVTQGGLFVDGPKTKQPYSFSDYGDETEIEYRDLVALVIEKSSFIFHPYFIVDDSDFVSEFPQLEKFYTDSYSIQDLKGILELPIGFMVDKLRHLPSGAAENLKIIASAQVADGEIDSVKKIKALNEFFDVDLNLIAELSKD